MQNYTALMHMIVVTFLQNLMDTCNIKERQDTIYYIMQCLVKHENIVMPTLTLGACLPDVSPVRFFTVRVKTQVNHQSQHFRQEIRVLNGNSKPFQLIPNLHANLLTY